MYPDGPGISGKKFVPQLALGCLAFTILGLLFTYGFATAMSMYLKKHPFTRQVPAADREHYH